MLINNDNKYTNKCSKCDTWSIDNNGGQYEHFGYGVRQWLITYWCDNCGEEHMIDPKSYKDGDTI